MKLYSCFVKKDSDGKIEDLILIHDGFSLSTFFLNSLFLAWFLYHKMWREFLVALVVLGIFSSFSERIFGFSGLYIESAFLFLIALNSNIWLAEHLKKKKNYQLSGFLFANNRAEATMKALDQIVKSVDNSTFAETFSARLYS